MFLDVTVNSSLKVSTYNKNADNFKNDRIIMLQCNVLMHITVHMHMRNTCTLFWNVKNRLWGSLVQVLSPVLHMKITDYILLYKLCIIKIMYMYCISLHKIIRTCSYTFWLKCNFSSVKVKVCRLRRVTLQFLEMSPQK